VLDIGADLQTIDTVRTSSPDRTSRTSDFEPIAAEGREASAAQIDVGVQEATSERDARQEEGLLVDIGSLAYTCDDTSRYRRTDLHLSVACPQSAGG
jgi:hypothetical protein